MIDSITLEELDILKKKNRLKRQLKSNVEDKQELGWETSRIVADAVWNDLHKELYLKNIIFAYKDYGDNGNLYQIVISKDNDSFTLGMTLTNKSVYIPNMSKESIKNVIVNQLSLDEDKLIDTIIEIINK